MIEWCRYQDTLQSGQLVWVYWHLVCLQNHGMRCCQLYKYMLPTVSCQPSGMYAEHNPQGRGGGRSHAIAPDVCSSPVHQPLIKLAFIPAALNMSWGCKPLRQSIIHLLGVCRGGGAYLSLFGNVSTPCECIRPSLVSPSYLQPHRDCQPSEATPGQSTGSPLHLPCAVSPLQSLPCKPLLHGCLHLC